MKQPVPIYIFLGTKAQLIKLAPVMLELDRRKWKYQILDTGQHTGLISEIMQEFSIREPDVRLYGDRQKGVSTLAGGCHWMVYLAGKYLPSARFIQRELFGEGTGLCLVHGDTMSTLLATLIAKRGGQKVVHVEAGLRSWRYFDPFPEEFVRLAVMRLSDYLFVPSSMALENLGKMSLLNRAYSLPGNTVLDTVVADLQRTPKSVPELPSHYALATVHRLETIYRRRNLNQVIDILLAAHQRQPLVFVQHRPTINRLRAYDLERVLLDAGVIQIPLLDHVSFLHLMNNASFVLTDGGSIQEEVSYLGVPCLVLRHAAERSEGLGENVLLSNLDNEKITEFLDNVEEYRRSPKLEYEKSPSAVIVDYLTEIGEQICE